MEIEQGQHMNPETISAEYESAWRTKLACPTRRYWLDRLMQTTGTYLAKWQWEVVKRLQDEWRHRTPMERANEQENAR